MKLRNLCMSLHKILFGNEVYRNLISIQNLNNEFCNLNRKIDLIINNIDIEIKEYLNLHFMYELHSINSNIVADSVICSDSDSGELDILANKYGSDKGNISKVSNYNTFFWYPHTYTKVYGVLFSKIRYDVKNIFECGIGTTNQNIASNMSMTGKPGASLRMWRDYFTNAIIWGGDIDRDVLFTEERINTGYIDQTSINSINEFFYGTGVNEFDIIDDGLHTYEAAASLFDSSIQYLSLNGLYIIEDLSINDIIKFQEHVSCSNKKFSVKYCIMCTPFSIDNNLVIIKKL